MSEPRWASRVEFVEYAEALGVATDAIMAVAASPDDDTTMVLFTPDPEQYPPVILGVKLGRQSDGVLVPLDAPRELPGMWEQVTRRMEHDLRDKFGDPEQ